MLQIISRQISELSRFGFGGIKAIVPAGWGVVRDLAHGARLAWISTTSVVLGFLLFLFAPQAQDLFLEVRGSWLSGIGYWLSFYVCVLIAWMAPVYVSSRWIMWRFREGATDWTQEKPVKDWVRRSLPSLSACGCLVAVLAGQVMALVNLITHNPQPASAADTASVPFGRRPSRVAASSRRDHSAD